MQIDVEIRGQKIKRLNSPGSVEDTQGYLQCKFDITGEEWSDTIRTAYFQNPKTGEKYGKVIGNDGTCDVPWEALTDSGFVNFSVVGKREAYRITTGIESFYNSKTVYPGKPSEEPTPDQYDQMISLAEETKEIAESVRKDADEGDFNGKDGASAYELAVKNGYEGTESEWLESLKYDHSEEFEKLAEQVQVAVKESADNAGKAEQAMVGANKTAQENIQAIQQASAQAQTDINASKESAVEAVENSRNTAAHEIATGKTDALESIENVKQEAIEEIESTGIPLEDIEKLAIKENAAGTRIELPDSAEWRIQSMKLYGHSTQQTTTGAQLANLPDLDPTEKNGITWSCSGGIVTANGTASSNSNTLDILYYDVPVIPGEYFLSGSVVGLTVYLRVVKDGAEEYKTGAITLDGTESSVTLYLMVSVGVTVNNAVCYPMLNVGSTGKPWEPYTGGEASPNPDYPQEIVSAGDDGSIQVDVGGRNIFDINQCVRFAQNTYGLKVEAQGDYFVISGTISVGEPEGSKVRPFQMCSYPEDLNGKHFITYVEESENIDPEYKWYVYSDKGDFNINIGLKYVQNNTYTYLKFKLMVTDEPGAFPYEPYKQPQTLAVQTPNGLPGIPVSSGGNYTDESGQQWICDEIDLKRGKYVQRVGSVLADGTVNKFSTSAGNVFWNLNTDHTAPGVISGKWYLSIYFSKDFFNANEPGEFIYVISEKGQEYFDTIEDLNAFCVEKNAEGNPLIIYYPMEPIETDLIQEQMEAYASLHTNYPTTVISNDSDAYMEVDYVADTKTYIDNKINDALQNIIANNLLSTSSAKALSAAMGANLNDRIETLEKAVE